MRLDELIGYRSLPAIQKLQYLVNAEGRTLGIAKMSRAFRDAGYKVLGSRGPEDLCFRRLVENTTSTKFGPKIRAIFMPLTYSRSIKTIHIFPKLFGAQ